MTSGRVLIVGGGLSDLAAVRRLHVEGVQFQFIEAGGRLGGRIVFTGVARRSFSDPRIAQVSAAYGADRR